MVLGKKPQILFIRRRCMLELSLKGNKQYWGWIGFLGIMIGGGTICFLWQLDFGLGITGLSRDVSWGFYVAQLTFLVGVATSAVMLVLPYYLHDYKAFGKITIIGEFVAVASICICLLFLFVDLGQPARALNIFLYPTPSSIIFWDGIVLTGYLILNIIVGWNVLEAERNSTSPPVWVKPLIYLSIYISISRVTRKSRACALDEAITSFDGDRYDTATYSPCT
jgi:[DsrC]-trisulfide reductase subunit P